MSDKIEKLVEDIHRLTKSISEGGHSSAAVEAKTAKVLEKMVQLETLCQSTIPELRAQLKARDKEIRRMKKELKEEKQENTSLEFKVKDLTDKKLKTKKSEAKATAKQERELKEEKFEKKYLDCREEVQEKKKRIEELQRRVSSLQEQNQGLKEQNEEKDLLIRNYSQQRNQSSQTMDDTLENISMVSSRGVMSMTESYFPREEQENEPLKPEDDAETDQESEPDSNEDQDSDSELEKIEVVEHQTQSQLIGVLEDEEIEKIEESLQEEGGKQQEHVEEGIGMVKVLKKVFWFLQ